MFPPCLQPPGHRAEPGDILGVMAQPLAHSGAHAGGQNTSWVSSQHASRGVWHILGHTQGCTVQPWHILTHS